MHLLFVMWHVYCDCFLTTIPALVNKSYVQSLLCFEHANCIVVQCNIHVWEELYFLSQ